MQSTAFIFYTLQLILLCSSQNTTTPLTTIPATTSKFATTTEEDFDFMAITQMDTYILLAVAIGCPLLIAILCCWQKRKTKQARSKREKVVAKNLKRALSSKQALMHQRHMQLQQRQHAMSVPSHPQAIEFTPKKRAQPISKTHTMPQNMTRKPSKALPQSTTRKTPQPKRAAAGFKPRKERNIPSTAPVHNETFLTEQNDDIFAQFKPAPPAGPPPDDIRPPPPAGISPKAEPSPVKRAVSVPKPAFMKVKQEKKELLSALELPVVEDDVVQSPPSEAPVAAVMVPLKSKESDSEEEIFVPRTAKQFMADNNGDDVIDMLDNDSSSGEPMMGAVVSVEDDKAMLNPKDKKSLKPMPSLEMIFGRSVDNKDDDSDEDSLLKRQADFAAHPSKVETPLVHNGILNEHVDIDIFSTDAKDEKEENESVEETESSDDSGEARARALSAATEIIHDI